MDERNPQQVPDPSSLTTQQLWREVAALKELLQSQLDSMEKAITVAHEDLVRVPTDVQKQVGNLKELQDAKFAAGIERHSELANSVVTIRSIIETRLDGMDKAIELLQATADKFPARMDEKIDAATGVHEEKFRSIQTQFTERDVRTEQTSRDSKVAVDAALQAAKEAVAEQNRSSALSITKSESATGKQIDQLVALIQSNTKAVDDKFDDIKERLTRIEGKGEAVVVAKADTRSADSQRQASSSFILAIVVGLAGVLIGLASIAIAFLKTQ